MRAGRPLCRVAPCVPAKCGSFIFGLEGGGRQEPRGGFPNPFPRRAAGVLPSMAMLDLCVWSRTLTLGLSKYAGS